jgi:hypothetical protein
VIFALDAANSPTLIRPNSFETLTTLSELKHASFGVALRRYEEQIHERKLTKRMLMKNTYPSASTNRPRLGVFLHYCRPAVIFESLLD